MPRSMQQKRQISPVELADRPWNIAQAADYLDVSERMIADLEKGDPPLPVHRLGTARNSLKRYYRSEIDEWLRSRWSSRRNGRTS